ncbi:MAG TPA: methyltransferase domain-containing protein [Mycobacteriales bacterium]|nr:methyltransferase domain-containing protein [Mycobacteriales bacterium]
MTTTAAFDWSLVAPAWEARREHVSRSHPQVADALVARLALGPGDRVLELGAGTGDLARRLAGLVEPGGSVLATDAAAGMVDVIARTCSGLTHVTPMRVDAADIPLPDDAVDAVAFQMGLMFVPEPDVAAAEARRVLVPGGRAAAAVWAGPEHNPWLTCLGMAAMTHGLVAGGPPTGPGGLFSLGTPESLRTALERGGFADVTVEEVPITMPFTDLDDYVDHVSHLSGPLAAALAAAPDKAEEVRATAAQLASRFVTDDGVRIPGLALVAAATA